jgi:hypothetical protein
MIDRDADNLARLAKSIDDLRSPVQSSGVMTCAGHLCNRAVSANADRGLCRRCLEDLNRRASLERMGVILPESRLAIPGIVS